MISQWINSLEAALEGLVLLLVQVLYLGVLFSLCVGLVFLLCLPLIIAYSKYLDRKEALAKQSKGAQS